MLKLRHLRKALIVAVGTLLMGTTMTAGAKTPAKVLGLNVESEDLNKSEKAALLKSLQATLRTYPSLDLVKAPDAELTDLMMDLECIDMDADCLGKVGKKYGATTVLYSQVDKKGGGFTLTVRIVDAKKLKVLHDKAVDVKNTSALKTALKAHIVQAFGKPPEKKVEVPKKPKKPKKPKGPKPGILMVKSSVPGAKIFVNGLYVGIGQIKVNRPPGKYTVKVTSAGYRDVLFNVQLKSGRKVKKRAKMKPTEVVMAKKEDKAVPVVVVADAPFYEKWWFWTAVGGGILLTTIIAAAASGDDDESVGSVIYSVDPQNAWRDVTVRGMAR